MTTTGFTVSGSIDEELAEPFEVGTVQWGPATGRRPP